MFSNIFYNFKMLITPERKVPQRSNASQNDHKRKGNPSKMPAAALAKQKLDEVDLRQIEYSRKKLIMFFYDAFFLFKKGTQKFATDVVNKCRLTYKDSYIFSLYNMK